MNIIYRFKDLRILYTARSALTFSLILLLTHSTLAQSGSPDHTTQLSSSDHVAQSIFPDHTAQSGSPDHTAQSTSPDHAAQSASSDHTTQLSSPDHAAQLSSSNRAAKSASSDHTTQISSPDQGLQQLLSSKELMTAHVGVYVYDDSLKKEIANYQGDKYFVPASNTKLFTLYAGMKCLGDSISGIRYFENDTALFISPTGDPSFLHPDFQSQPVVDFLKQPHKKIYLVDQGWQETPLGKGWAWDDMNEDYSTERSQFPVYGNFIRWTEQKSTGRNDPSFGPTSTVFSSPEIPWITRFAPNTSNVSSVPIVSPFVFQVKREPDSNVFIIHLGNEAEAHQDVPFVTNNMNSAAELLPDTIGKPIGILNGNPLQKSASSGQHTTTSLGWHTTNYQDFPYAIHSRPVDSIFMPMMFRSDNFFAEQTLLMVSKQKLQFMKDETIIDTLLNGALADLPQKPVWVDGSGLSRHNLFSPGDFVTLLIKLKNEFGMDRMKRILPTGGRGTLKNYYHADSGYIFAKTGSMEGVVGISGYVYTLRGHLLEFCVLVNNHSGSASPIRKEIESYVEYLRRNN